MKVMFWNTQRLGKGSQGKPTMVGSVIAHAIDDLKVDICLFCEITSDITIDDVTVTKQLAVTKRDRSKSSAQLGYGCVISDGSQGDLIEFQIPGYREVIGHNISYRGGDAFTKQSKRKVAECGEVGSIPLFMYHANASYKSTKLVQWIVNALDESYTRFLLVGDFNCSPQALGNAIGIDHIKIAEGGATHNVKSDGGPLTTLDYAVGKGINPTVSVLNKTEFFEQAGLSEMPDHLPIIVEF